MAAPNADFQFTEGHVRLLLWMCQSHQEWIDSAIAEVMKNGEQPTENLMRCREGIADLKCWGWRLLEIIEATPDDGDDDEEYDDEDEDDELGDFAADLEAQWRLHRSAGRRAQNPVQKLRSWLVSLLR
jgi:hypothetical protein